LRSVFVVAQIALSFLLLVTAGLFVRSLRQAQRIDPGFNADNLLLIAALGLTRLLTGFLYDVNAADPITYTAITLLLTAAALLACYLPARRAAQVEPIRALRYD
jgi:hypothetical protein